MVIKEKWKCRACANKFMYRADMNHTSTIPTCPKCLEQACTPFHFAAMKVKLLRRNKFLEKAWEQKRKNKAKNLKRKARMLKKAKEDEEKRFEKLFSGIIEKEAWNEYRLMLRKKIKVLWIANRKVEAANCASILAEAMQFTSRANIIMDIIDEIRLERN